jgi:galactose mutarotase-like enzyme
VSPIQLSNADNTALVDVFPDRGAIITRWCVQGREILYLDAQRFADPTLSVRGGIPILFPICGNLPNNSYSSDGTAFHLKQHGFARDLPWTVVEQDRSQLILRLEHNAQTLSQYPYPFRFTLTYRLQATNLVLQSQIENLSDRPMPFSLGFHPYFTVMDKTAIEFDIPAAQGLDQKTGNTFPYQGNLELTVAEVDVAFFPVTAQQAILRDRQQNLTLTLSYEDCFSTLVVWTLAGKDYVCLEPWTAPRNALNTGRYLLHIPPQQTFQGNVQLSVVL